MVFQQQYQQPQVVLGQNVQEYNPATYGQQVMYATPVEVQEAPGGPMYVQQQPQYVQQGQIVAAPNGAPEPAVYGTQIIQAPGQQLQLVEQPQQQIQLVQQQPQQQVQLVQQPQQQVQVIQQGQIGGAPVKHVPLAKCRVLYLGCAVPLETAVGLEAIQGPLRERYDPDSSEMQGIDAWLTIYSSGMQLKFVEDGSAVHWFPISSLHVCAAVKAINLVLASGGKQAKFVALDSEHGQKSAHPPIFAAIMRRTKGRKVLECHAFICKSNQAAMALVQSCTHAYEHKEGWCDDAPPADMAEGHDPMRLLAAEPQQVRDAPNEYYKEIPKAGYFYTPNQGLVKNYAVNGNKERKEPQPVPQPPPPQPIAQPQMQVVPQPPQQQMQTILEPVLVPVGPQGQPMMGPQMMGAPRPELAQYFGDWNAFPGHPVAILGGQPMPPKPKKKKKKKKKRSDECCTDDVCCCATDDCCQDVCNKQEYFVDHYYEEYNQRRKEKRREREERKREREEERRIEPRHKCDHKESFPPRSHDRDRRDDRRRDDYIIRREPDYRDEPPRREERRPRRDPYYDDPYIRDYYAPPQSYQPARAPVYEEDFQFYGPGYAYAPGYDDYYGGYNVGYGTGYGMGYGEGYGDAYPDYGGYQGYGGGYDAYGAGGYGGGYGYDPYAQGDQYYDGGLSRQMAGTRLY